MNNDELNDLDAMTGLEGGGGQGMVLDLLSLNGDAEIVEVDGKYETKGGYYRLLKLTQAKKNEKPEEERLGDRVSVVFLKVRRALQQRAADGKLRLWTSEHSTADDTVELHSSKPSFHARRRTARRPTSRSYSSAAPTCRLSFAR